MIGQNSSIPPQQPNNTIVGATNVGNQTAMGTAKTNSPPPIAVPLEMLDHQTTTLHSSAYTIPEQYQYIRDLPVEIFLNQPEQDPARLYAFSESYVPPEVILPEMDATDPGVGSPTAATAAPLPVSSGTRASVETPSEYSSSANGTVYYPSINETINSQLFNHSAITSSSSSSDFNVSLSAYIPPLNPSMVSYIKC